MDSDPIDDMFDSPRQECNTSSLFRALVAEALLYSYLTDLDAFLLIPGLMTSELMEYLNNFQMTRIDFFFAACNLSFVRLDRRVFQFNAFDVFILRIFAVSIVS